LYSEYKSYVLHPERLRCTKKQPGKAENDTRLTPDFNFFRFAQQLVTNFFFEEVRLRLGKNNKFLLHLFCSTLDLH